MYHQAALYFADLHDKPQRMLEKGTICEIIPWTKSRYLLFWRLRRLLYEDRLKIEIASVVKGYDDGQTSNMIKRWFIEHYGQHNQYLFDDNRCVSEWLQSQLDNKTSAVQDNLECLRKDSINHKLSKLFEDEPDPAFQALLNLTTCMAPSQRCQLKELLEKLEGVKSVPEQVAPDLDL